MRRIISYGVTACALLLTGGAASAQLTAADAHSQSKLLSGTLRLGVEEAIALGIQNNLNVEVQRHAPLIAHEDAAAAWGAYDPELYGEAGYNSSTEPNSFGLNGATVSKDRRGDGKAGLRGVLPYLGASYGLEYSGSRTNTNSTIQSLRPQYDAGLTFNARLPLLKGLIWSGPWTQVKTSALRHKSSSENFRSSLMETVRGIEIAYWDLVARNEDERVARKSLETAAALLEQSQTEYEVGVKSRVDVYESEAGKAEREFELIRAENLALNAQDTLIDQVLGSKLTASSSLEIEPTDDPDNVIEFKIDVENATKEAFRRRPELASLRHAVEEKEIQVKFAKNQRLPQLDILGSVGTSGKDGVTFPARPFPPGTPPAAGSPDPDTPIRTHGYDDANSQLFNSSGGDGHSVRAVLTIPLGMIAGRHNVSRSQLELRRSVTELRRQEQAVIVEIRRAARNLESAQRGIASSEQRRVAAQEQLRAEKIRLEHGESTPFEVLQRERDLVDAERQKIVALQLYRNSITDLHRFQGTILDVHHISISDAETLR